MSIESLGNQSTSRNVFRDLSQKALSSKDFLSLPKQDRDLLMRDSAGETLSILRKSGALEYENIAEMYSALRGEELLVRREDPVKLLSAIADRESVEIDFPSEERYSNAVEWSPGLASRGLQNAYLEGHGQYNGTVAVVGFHKTEAMDVQSVADAAQNAAGLDREYVRSIRGSYSHEDIIFVTLRLPATAVKEIDMTERELDLYEEYKERSEQGELKNPLFIHRGFLFTDHLKKQ
jgi:hypothetical protein